jgi:hypothetical protein
VKRFAFFAILVYPIFAGRNPEEAFECPREGRRRTEAKIDGDIFVLEVP